MLYRFSESYDVDISVHENATLTIFDDAQQISTWAETEMLWAVDNGLIPAAAGTTLNPSKNVTRAEYATILYRLLQY